MPYEIEIADYSVQSVIHPDGRRSQPGAVRWCGSYRDRREAQRAISRWPQNRYYQPTGEIRRVPASNLPGELPPARTKTARVMLALGLDAPEWGGSRVKEQVVKKSARKRKSA